MSHMHFCIAESSIDQCACQRYRRVFCCSIVSLLLDHSAVKGPEAVTAPLGSNATFTCVVENADQWVINTNITLSHVHPHSFAPRISRTLSASLEGFRERRVFASKSGVSCAMLCNDGWFSYLTPFVRSAPARGMRNIF